jgi:hypothetical protein
MLARLRARLPAVRGALIALVIALSIVEGCPLPRAHPAVLAHPANQRELARWSKILASIGYERTPDALGREAYDVSDRLARVHRVVTTPIRPVFDLANLSQRWSLFPVADPAPYRMHVDADCGAGFEPLFIALDDEHDYDAAVLEYRRIRGIWNPGTSGTRPGYDAFTTWLARRIFADRPECSAVRVRFEQFFITLPSEPEDPTRTFAFEVVRTREGT